VSWIGYLGGLLVGLVVAFVVAPLFPDPLGPIVYWLALVVAALCAVLLVWWLIAGRPRGPRDPVA
jgi:multisubunit Na+/H+ antiporter MnhE subunit